MRMDDFEEAGRFGNRSRPTVSPDDYEDGISSVAAMAFLPVGNGLSHGDVCRNQFGTLIESRKHNRILSFDPGSGTIRCEAGTILADLLARAVRIASFFP